MVGSTVARTVCTVNPDTQQARRLFHYAQSIDDAAFSPEEGQRDGKYTIAIYLRGIILSHGKLGGYFKPWKIRGSFVNQEGVG